MNTFVAMIIGIVGGALSGWLAGFIINYLTWWRKDFRDIRHSRAGLHLLADRVFPHYQMSLAIWGAICATFLLLIGVPLIWAVLAILIIPILFLLILIISAILIFFQKPLLREQSFHPQILVGKDVAKAVEIVQENGWNYEVVDDLPSVDLNPLPLHPDLSAYLYPVSSHYRRFVEIKVRDGKVTKAILSY